MLRTLLCALVLLVALVFNAEAVEYKNVQLLDHEIAGTDFADSLIGISCWGYEDDGDEYALFARGYYYFYYPTTAEQESCKLFLYKVNANGGLDFQRSYPAPIYGEKTEVYTQSADDSAYAYVAPCWNSSNMYIYNLSNTESETPFTTFNPGNCEHGLYIDQEAGVLYIANIDSAGTELYIYYIKDDPMNPTLLGTWNSAPLDTMYSPPWHNENGISEVYTTGSIGDNYKIYIANTFCGLVIADLNCTVVGTTLVSISLDTSAAYQFKYRSVRDTDGPDSTWLCTHSVWVDDSVKNLFVVDEVEEFVKGNHWGTLKVFDIDSLMENAVNINNGINTRTPWAIYDVLLHDNEGTIYTGSEGDLSIPDSNTTAHFVQISGNKVCLSYYNKGLRILKFNGQDDFEELGYWDPECLLNYSIDTVGGSPVYGTYGTTYGTYGLYAMLPSKTIITSSHDGIRTFRYARMGTLAVSETWEDTVIVFGDVYVPSGCTLTIDAGCLVKFQELADSSHSGQSSTKCELIVNGTLDVNGAEGNEVVFTSDATSPSSADWYGIVCGSSGSIYIDHARVEYAYSGVHAISGADSVYVGNSQFYENYFRALWLNDGDILVQGNTISDMGASSTVGIFIYHCAGKVISNDLSGQLGYGIYVANTDSCKVLYNTVREYNNTGLFCMSCATEFDSNVVLDAAGASSNAATVHGIGANLTLVGNHIRADDEDASCYRGVFFYVAAAGSLRNNIIEDFTEHGVYCWSSSDGDDIDCGTSGDHGNNSIYWNLDDKGNTTGNYLIDNDDNDCLYAVGNYFGPSPDSSDFDPPVEWSGSLSLPPAGALIAYFPLDEGSGDTAYDHGMFGLKGVCTTATWIDTGLDSSALYYDGGDYVTVAYDTCLDVKRALTVGVWFKTTTAQSNKFLLAKIDETTFDYGLLLQSGSTTMVSYVRIASGGLRMCYKSGYNFYNNQWHYFTSTFDGRYLKIYVDGDSVNVYDQGSYTDLYTDNKPLCIVPDSTFGGFVGVVDEAKVYSRVLSSKEIGEYFNDLEPAGKAAGEPSIIPAQRPLTVLEDKLVSVRPNPFKEATEICFRVPVKPYLTSKVTMRIYSVDGQLVKNMVDKELVTGREYRIQWERSNNAGTKVQPGMYYYDIQVGDKMERGKVFIME